MSTHQSCLFHHYYIHTYQFPFFDQMTVECDGHNYKMTWSIIDCIIDVLCIVIINAIWDI